MQRMKLLMEIKRKKWPRRVVLVRRYETTRVYIYNNEACWNESFAREMRQHICGAARHISTLMDEKKTGAMWENCRCEQQDREIERVIFSVGLFAATLIEPVANMTYAVC